jgi:hypothetical protein
MRPLAGGQALPGFWIFDYGFWMEEGEGGVSVFRCFGVSGRKEVERQERLTRSHEAAKGRF